MNPLGLVTLQSSAHIAPCIPRSCRSYARELARFEWRVGDPGDPAALAEAFLAEHKVRGGDPICGATVLISAAASAVMIGGPKGAPSPAPAVPDMALVVYEHAGYQNPDQERGEWRLGPWQASWTPSQHEAAVCRVHEAITRGDVYQVNVVGHSSAEYEGDPMRALHRLTRLAGAKYAGVLGGEGWAVACASPETLLEVRGGRAVVRPIKGTAPATAEGKAALLASPKERAEHVMIVDLVRNDLAHVAVTGSVRVPRLFAVRKWSDLWQAESEVEAVLRQGIGFADLLRSVCPGGSVTGAPKLAALAEIERLEPVGRGPAMGVFGWIGPEHLDLGLTIRTVAVDGHRVHLWAGGGIVIDSDPAAEVAEAAAKAAPVKRALAGWPSAKVPL